MTYSASAVSVETVLAREVAGGKVRFVLDYYGGLWVKLTTGWVFKSTTRHKLKPDELVSVKSAIKTRL